LFTGACPLPESTKDSTAPRGTFATCGADGSVRLWHLGWEEQGDAGGEPGDAPIGGDLKRIRGVSTAVSAMYAAPDPSRESAALREVEKQAGAVADECAVARAGGKTNVGASAQSFSSKIVSKENWLFQAVDLLGNLGKSEKKYDQL